MIIIMIFNYFCMLIKFKTFLKIKVSNIKDILRALIYVFPQKIHEHIKNHWKVQYESIIALSFS